MGIDWKEIRSFNQLFDSTTTDVNSTFMNTAFRMPLLLFLLLATFIGKAQTLSIKGYILNEQNGVVEGASVLINNKVIIRKTDATGFFNVTVKWNDTISVRKGDARDSYIANRLTGQDTAILIFQLFNKSRILEEITVRGSRVKLFDGDMNENLLDYYVYQDGSFISIKKVGQGFFLDLAETGKEKKRFELAFEPTELSTDCRGNFLILTKDSVYETWIDDQIHFTNSIPREQFEGNVKNLVYCSDNLFMDYRYEYLNRKYSLKFYNKDTSYIFFNAFDTLGYYTIYEQISDFKAKTTGRTGPVMDSIPLKYQTMLNSQNRETICAAAKTLRHGTDFIALQVQNKLNIQSERVNFNLVTVDFSTSKLHVFDRNGRAIHNASIDRKGLETFRLIKDPYTDHFYITDPEKALFSLARLSIENGRTEEILNLREVSYPEKVKIFNHTLYFIAANEKGFRKVFSVRLEE
jgi:hypothetical protein